MLLLVKSHLVLRSKTVNISTIFFFSTKLIFYSTKMVTAAHSRVQQDELKSMKNSMIRYILNVSSKKTPFKSADIVKHCLKGEQKMFVHLLPEVEDMLSDVYGLRVSEVKEKTNKFYLTTSEFACGSASEFHSSQKPDLRLLLIVLSYIFMKGGRVLEPALFAFLRKLRIEEEPHEYFGYFKKNINEKFVKQLYLKKEKVEMESGNIQERFQYSWGHRADLEFNKKDCLEYVANLMKRPITSYTKQFEECDSDAEGEEDMEMADI